jgi:hypothetical protein
MPEQTAAQPLHKYPKTMLTHWELWSYDVWGNRRDGYEVNDRSCFARDYVIRAKVQVFNPGKDTGFAKAHPSDYQITKAFGVTCKVSLDGDGEHIYLERESDGYPIGEAHLIRPDSVTVKALED